MRKEERSVHHQLERQGRNRLTNVTHKPLAPLTVPRARGSRFTPPTRSCLSSMRTTESIKLTAGYKAMQTGPGPLFGTFNRDGK
jgi:hypothetical protein